MRDYPYERSGLLAIIIVRTVILFACIIAAMRLMGKRQLGQLELSELVVAVLISDMAAHPLQDIGIPLIYGLVPIAVLLCCELLISWLSLKSIGFRRVLFGKPCFLIRDGRIDQAEMKRNRFSLDELSEQLRKQGVTDIGSLHSAILETDGTLTIILRAGEKPPTVSQLQLAVEERGVPVTLIGDGKLERLNLRMLGKDVRWLQKELASHRIRTPSDVYYMSIDEQGEIHLEAKEPEL